MNQFRTVDFKGNKQAINIAKDFDYILNNLWCTYSEAKGRKRWNKISGVIPSKFYSKILTEIGHVESGHGREQSLMAVKSEMVKYLNYIVHDKE